MAKVYGTESDTPSVKPMTHPSVITSGEIYDLITCSGLKKANKEDKKALRRHKDGKIK